MIQITLYMNNFYKKKPQTLIFPVRPAIQITET